MTSNEALFDERLPLATRTVYSQLQHLLWLHRPDRREQSVIGIPVTPPPQRELAAELGLSLPALHRHLARLREAGYLDWRRRSRRAPLCYRIFDRPQEELPAWPDEPECSAGVTTECSAGDTTARAFLAFEDEDLEDVGRSYRPPQAVASATTRDRVTPFRALVEECDIQADDERARRQTAIALNDGRDGIRALHRVEVGSDAGLVEAIRRKAELYRTSMPDAELTPMGLRQWWIDLEWAEHRTIPVPYELTAAEMESMGIEL